MNINQDNRMEPSFSLANRLARAFWAITWILLGRLSPTPMHAWRAFLLRLFGAKIGQGVRVYPAVKIWAPWNLEIGDQTGVANGVILYCQGKIIIGRRAVISQGAHLCGGTHDYTSLSFSLITKNIIIGDEVWVAAEAFVHPGVVLGKGAILGARGVATKDLMPWSIYAGNPAVKIKDRLYENNKN